MTGVVTCGGFLVIHIFSLIKIDQYGDEVVSSKSYDKIMGAIYPILSLLTVITGIIFSLVIAPKRISRSMEDGHKQWLEKIAAAVISANIIYVGSYFLPYMLAAFIHSPVLTAFTHLMGLLLIICIYWIFLGVWCLFKLFKSKKLNRNTRVTKFLNTVLYCCMGWAVAFSFIILIFIITIIVTLGRFEDLEELNSLAPSLLIAAFGLLLLKSVYSYVMNKIKDTNKDGQPAAQEASNTRREEQNLVIRNSPIPLITIQ